MLQFKSIELKDREIINSYLAGQNYRASDLCFTNLYCWGKKFDTQFAVTDDWLFIRFKDNNKRNSYLKPIGTGDIKEGIGIIQEDHKLFNNVFQIRGLTREMMDEIEAAMPGRFDYKLNMSVSDYIYTTEKLTHLNGKKLQSKRNHINRFIRENDWKYRSLTGNPALVKECKSMLDKWMDINIEEKDPSLLYDDFATTDGVGVKCNGVYAAITACLSNLDFAAPLSELGSKDLADEVLKILPIHRGEVVALIQCVGDVIGGDEPTVFAIYGLDGGYWREAVQL